MTTPDTLASLIAKWRDYAHRANVGAEQYDAESNAFCILRSESVRADICADELEAALDALAERWEELADSAECCEKEAIRLNYPPEKIETHARAKHNLRLCVAELRGRGAGE